MKSLLYFLCGLLLLTACKRNRDEAMEIPPSVTSFWPNSGKAGTIVTIHGTGFDRKNSEADFNGTAAAVVSVNDTIMTVLAPAGGSSGKLSVKTGDKTLEAGTYTYQDLSMRGVNPLNGPAGTNVVIIGEGFSSMNAPAKVMINGKEATITSVNDTTLIAAVPVSAGSGTIRVVVDGKEVTGPAFLFQDISKIKPLKGGKGTHVTITGEGFNTVSAGNAVAFNGKVGTVISATATQLVVATPDDVATGPLSVTINGQKTVGPVFTVIPPPVLNTIAPLSGPAGRDVTITGANFSSLAEENNVTFNGVAGVVKQAGEKELIVTIPAGAGTGNMKVWVNGQETGGPQFREQNLGVVSLSPDNGLAGTTITVSGIGFSSNPAENIVTFNGVTANVVSATATTLAVIAPVNVTTGTVNVKVSSLDAIGPVFKRAGVVTLAGGPGTGMFTNATGLTGDRNGNLYFLQGLQVKKISPDGTVSDYAGGAVGGHVDGPLADALFQNPRTITADIYDNLYVLDGTGQRYYVRKITPAGQVSTVLNIIDNLSGALAVDNNGVIYVSKMYQGVYKSETNGSLTKFSTFPHSVPDKMAVDALGKLYYAGGDYYNPYIVVVPTSGQNSYHCGSLFDLGFVDGDGAAARLGSPLCTTLDPTTGNIFFVDNMNMCIRYVTPSGTVKTVTGAAGTFESFKSGYKDGTLNEALFKSMNGIHVDRSGNIYVLDQQNNAVRKIFLK
ncbi:IPT/TIG domain-containing protein [Chitinophaga eiseniae]|uniref:IPT/TIG domain-containing protein n=1 Tax=Chitinophaga eiseniae TaxID=634771 RepID=A0A1T4M6F4_9BACT|nr:IPT/TIG domain-containing protein [Chitinophaga eiseniae]SJZ62579.1 IPT/TIG domain-containing protein [Chitinophaga eiseniae]